LYTETVNGELHQFIATVPHSISVNRTCVLWVGWPGQEKRPTYQPERAVSKIKLYSPPA